jgi:hypothetical protein
MISHVNLDCYAMPVGIAKPIILRYGVILPDKAAKSLWITLQPFQFLKTWTNQQHDVRKHGARYHL